MQNTIKFSKLKSIIAEAEDGATISNFEVVDTLERVKIEIAKNLCLNNISFNMHVEFILYPEYEFKCIRCKANKIICFSKNFDIGRSKLFLKGCLFDQLFIEYYNGVFKSESCKINSIRLRGQLHFANMPDELKLETSFFAKNLSVINAEILAFGTLIFDCDTITFTKVSNLKSKKTVISFEGKSVNMKGEISSIEFLIASVSDSLRFENVNFKEVTFKELHVYKSLETLNSNIEDLRVQLLMLLDKTKLKINSLNSTSRLRLMCERNNFIYYAKYFQSVEQDKYYNTLTWSKNFPEKLPLALSLYTNTFGRSWFLPIVLLLVSTHTIYLVACYFYVYPDLTNLWNKFFNGHSWTFLLPTHRYSTVFPDHEHLMYKPVVLFIDFIQRVVSGFMIFQFIRAFRFNFSTK